MLKGNRMNHCSGDFNDQVQYIGSKCRATIIREFELTVTRNVNFKVKTIPNTITRGKSAGG